jgi:putative ABC transport system permease protein
MITNFQVAYKNLLRKRIRSLLTVIGIALSSWVLVSLLGFNQGYEAALNKDIDNMGFSLMIMAKGCPYEAATLMLKGGTGLKYMKESVMADLAKESEVEKTTPILMAAVFDPNKGESGGIAGYFGVEPKSFSAMKTFLTFRQGGWFTDEHAYEVVMGYEAAELEQREVGDLILMPEKNIEFKVVGILNRTGTQDDGTIFAPLKTMQTIFKKPGEITTIGIKVKKDADSSKLETALYQTNDRAWRDGLMIAETMKPKEKAPAVVPRSQPNSSRIGGNSNENAVRALTATPMVTKTTATMIQP